MKKQKTTWARLRQPLLLSLLVNLLLFQLVAIFSVQPLVLERQIRELTPIYAIIAREDTPPPALVALQTRSINDEQIIVALEPVEEEEIEEEELPANEELEDPPNIELTDYTFEGGIGTIITEPILLAGRNDPRMPLSLKESGWEGAVTIALYIDDDGNVKEIWVLETSGRDDADRDAISCYRNTSWNPATRNGDPIPVILEHTVEYIQAHQIW
ncbi:energy transducer TonB [bacterium]|nr:energy transducer TonB [bacterium]